MKLLLTLFSAVVVTVSAMSEAEQKAMLVGVAQECKVSEGASDSDLSLIILKKPMTSKEGKCLFACILEGVGIMENNKWNEQGFMEFVEVPLKKDADKMSKVQAIAKKCQEKNKDISERCEVASKGNECLRKGLKKVNIDIGF